jgi:hypothetical protein
MTYLFVGGAIVVLTCLISYIGHSSYKKIMNYCRQPRRINDNCEPVSIRVDSSTTTSGSTSTSSRSSRSSRSSSSSSSSNKKPAVNNSPCYQNDRVNSILQKNNLLPTLSVIESIPKNENFNKLKNNSFEKVSIENEKSNDSLDKDIGDDDINDDLILVDTTLESIKKESPIKTPQQVNSILNTNRMFGVDISNQQSNRPEAKVPIENVFEYYSSFIFSNREWRRSNYIYHYTSTFYAKLILRDQVINTTTCRIPNYEHGVFLTIHPPSESTHFLVQNNYRGNNKYISRVECAFGFPRSEFFGKITKKNDRDNRDIHYCKTPILLGNHKYSLILR